MAQKPLDHDRKVFEIFEAVLDLPFDERTSYIQKACHGDPGLAQSVFAYLGHAQKSNAGLSFDTALLEKIKTEAQQFFQDQIPLEPGQCLAHYRLAEKLGEGGMGLIFLAEDLKLQRQVALKFLPYHLSIQPEMLRRFKMEAEAVAKLNHPNIVTIHGIENTGDHHFLVMEYLNGATLDHHLQANGLDSQSFLTIARPLLKGLAAAHDAGIVHRDIKPANIMVENNGTIKLLDFGLAKSLRNALDSQAITQAPSKHLAGTLSYMSPEQIRMERITPASDLFSLGIVFCQLLSGQHPYSGKTGMEVASAILRDKPKPPAGSNRNIQQLYKYISQSYLHQDPACRPTAVQALHDLTAGKKAFSKTYPYFPTKKKGTTLLSILFLILISILIIHFSRRKNSNNNHNNIFTSSIYLSELKLSNKNKNKFQKALKYYGNENMAKAKTMCNEILLSSPNNPSVLFFLANLESNMDNYEKAYEHYKIAYRHVDESQSLWTSQHIKGAYHMHHLNYEEAKGDYEILLEEYPKDNYAKIQYSQCLAELRKKNAPETAKSAFENSKTRRNFSNYLFTLVEYSKFENAIQLAHNHPEFFGGHAPYVHWPMALAYLGLEDYGMALEHANKMIQYPNDSEAQEWGKMIRSDIELVYGDLDRSIQTLQDEILENTSFNFRDNKARIIIKLASRLYYAGNIERALELIDELSKLLLKKEQPSIWDFRHISNLTLLCLKMNAMDRAEPLLQAMCLLAEAEPNSHPVTYDFQMSQDIYKVAAATTTAQNGWNSLFQETDKTPPYLFWEGIFNTKHGKTTLAIRNFKSILGPWRGQILYRGDPILLLEAESQLINLTKID